MFPETSLTIQVSQRYLIKWLTFSALLGSAPAIGVVAFMRFYGFDIALAIGATSTAVFMFWVVYRTYRKGTKQAIHLHPNKIIFDYITYKQEFLFASPREWKINEKKGNWEIQSQLDHSFKLVPKSAFPQLKDMAGRFYANET